VPKPLTDSADDINAQRNRSKSVDGFAARTHAHRAGVMHSVLVTRMRFDQCLQGEHCVQASAVLKRRKRRKGYLQWPCPTYTTIG
jgi:hypothetical protein